MVFEIVDRKGRNIKLTAERWKHIKERHPELSNKIELIQQTMIAPSFQVQDETNPHLFYNHTYDKEVQLYLIIAIKYLNNEGFIITAFYSKYKKK